MTTSLSPVQGKLFGMQIKPRKSPDEPIKKLFGFYFHPTLLTYQFGLIVNLSFEGEKIVGGAFMKTIPEDIPYLYDPDSQSILISSEVNVGKTYNPIYLSGQSDKTPPDAWANGEAVVPFTKITTHKYGLIWQPQFENLMLTNKSYFVPSDNLDINSFMGFFKKNLLFTEMDMGKIQTYGNALYEAFEAVVTTKTAHLLSWNFPQTILMGSVKVQQIKNFKVV